MEQNAWQVIALLAFQKAQLHICFSLLDLT